MYLDTPSKEKGMYLNILRKEMSLDIRENISVPGYPKYRERYDPMVCSWISQVKRKECTWTSCGKRKRRLWISEKSVPGYPKYRERYDPGYPKYKNGMFLYTHYPSIRMGEMYTWIWMDNSFMSSKKPGYSLEPGVGGGVSKYLRKHGYTWISMSLYILYRRYPS